MSKQNPTMRPVTGGKSLIVFSTYQERQEALKRTTMMADDVNHRNSVMPHSSTTTTTPTPINNNEKFSNGKLQQQQNNQNNIPPPPPQFANSPPKTSNFKGPTATTRNRPPTSPTPDYDNVQMRTNGPVASKSGAPSQISNQDTSRRTLRLGTVSIGEYERQRKDPTKFDFLGAPQPPPPPPQQQQRNGSAESEGNNNYNNKKSSLHHELQHTLTRSNLKNSHMAPQEHQSNCPNMQSQHGQRLSVNASNGNMSTLNRLTGEKLPTSSTMRNGGILKNGGSSGSSGTMHAATKSTEKTISFGN